MTYQLGKNVSKGDKILLKTGWHKIEIIKETGVETKSGFIEYGEEISGWKK